MPAELAHKLWRSLMQAGGRTLTDGQIQQLELFLELLQRANSTMNLTRVADPTRGRLLHVADSLTLLPHLPGDTSSVCDVGSGGGVPGLVLAIVLPETAITLVEATRKKAEYLRAAAAELALGRVTVRAQRAEDFARVEGRERFDVVTARAVAALPQLLEWCLPLTRVGGCVLAMKGPRVADELPAAQRALARLGAAAPVVHAAPTLPGAEGHVICEVHKVGRPATMDAGGSSRQPSSPRRPPRR